MHNQYYIGTFELILSEGIKKRKKRNEKQRKKKRREREGKRYRKI